MTAEVVSTPSGVLPLTLHTAPLASFVEVHLQPGGPHRAVEVQRLELDDGPITIVATHRPTGELDVLVPAGHGLDRTWFERDPFLAHMTYGSMAHVAFRADRCVVGEDGIEVDVDVDHPAGHRLEVRVSDDRPRPGRPRFVPTVAGQRQPMTLRFMLGGRLRRLTTGIGGLRVAADGIELAPRRFPAGLAWSPLLAARSGSDVFGVGLNLSIEQHRGPLVGGVDERDPAVLVEPAWDEHGCVELIAARGADRLAFRLLGGGPGVESGRFEVDSPLGVVAVGAWRLERHDDGLGLVLSDIVQRWSPGWRGGLRLPAAWLRRLRRRNESWTWSGRSTISRDGVSQTGRWYVATPNPE